jgi:uncharacterized protein (TIGR03437 family)
MMRPALLAIAALAAGAQDPPVIAGCAVFPASNAWNTAVDRLPIHPLSDLWVRTIGADQPVHPDFGSGIFNGGPIGIPFLVVPGTQPAIRATFEYAGESDPGPYRVPLDAPIEGGAQSTGDRHAIALDRDNCVLYELYAAYPQPDGTWRAGSGAIFDLKAHRLRPAGWTSADAAGLPILPGLVRYDEVAGGEIRHANRFTVRQTRRAYVWPARHFASPLTGEQYPPMGQRFRLKADVNISDFHSENQVILRALKKYGIILADNGSNWFLSGAPDERWNNTRLRELRRLRGSDFEAVDASGLIRDADSGEAFPPPAPQRLAHAATFEPGAVSPDQFVSLFPPAPATAVFFDGSEAPVFYRSPEQINTATPAALRPGATVRVRLAHGDRTIWEEDAGVVESAPGLFAAQNQDYSFNAEEAPSERGAFVILYGTGAGAASTHAVRIGGLEAEVAYAGPVIGYGGALTQLNVRVPAGLGAGDHPVVWVAGRYSSPATFSIWVR